MPAKKAIKKDPDPADDSSSDVEHNEDFKATLKTKSDRMVRNIQCTIPGGISAVVSPCQVNNADTLLTTKAAGKEQESIHSND